MHSGRNARTEKSAPSTAYIEVILYHSLQWGNRRCHCHSPNAEEAFSLLGIKGPVTQRQVERAAATLSDGSSVTVIIRCGAMGAYRHTHGKEGRWVEAFWTKSTEERVVDVTGKCPTFDFVSAKNSR
jgi:sugar/nucleoside kinase (ribokinase family)